MKDLGGRVAVITGASRGIGEVIAQTLFDSGMKVVMSARTGPVLEAARDRIDHSAERTLAVAGDVSVEADRVRLLGAARDRFDAIDVLVNNAGVEGPEAFVDMDFERVEAMFATNVLALMRLTQLALPEMLARGSGHVVNMASLAALAPSPYLTSYGATKGAVLNFSESLRWELKGTGVGVSAVCPGFVRDAGMFVEHKVEAPMLSGTVSPQEVADAVVRAIRLNRSRVVVVPPTGRGAAVLTALAPDLLHKVVRRAGVIDMLKGSAERYTANRDVPAGGTVVAPESRAKPKLKPATGSPGPRRGGTAGG